MLRATWPEISDPTRASGYTNPVAPTASSRPSSASASGYLQSEGQPLFRPDIRGPCNTDLPRLGDLCLFPGASTISTPHTGSTISDDSFQAQLNTTSSRKLPGSPSQSCPQAHSSQTAQHSGWEAPGDAWRGWPPSSGLTPGIISGAVGSSEPWPGASSHQVQVQRSSERPLCTPSPGHQGPGRPQGQDGLTRPSPATGHRVST